MNTSGIREETKVCKITQKWIFKFFKMVTTKFIFRVVEFVFLCCIIPYILLIYLFIVFGVFLQCKVAELL